MTTSPYYDLVGVARIASHYSDLYVRAGAEAYAILRKHNTTIMTFRNNLDGELWYDVSFAYDPFWRDAMRPKPFNYSGLM